MCTVINKHLLATFSNSLRPGLRALIGFKKKTFFGGNLNNGNGTKSKFGTWKVALNIFKCNKFSHRSHDMLTNWRQV